MLLPQAGDDVDLVAAYAYPDGRRWLRANMVSSVDGAAELDGRSGGLGGKADRALFGLLRGLSDVIIVGAGTARVERYGPAQPLAAYAQWRRAAGQLPAPVIAVVSGSLDLDLGSALFTGADPPTIVVTTGAADTARQHRTAEVAEVADLVVAGDHELDLGAMLDALERRGHRRLLCEGGPRLLGHVVAAGLLDELCLTVGSLLTAGAAARILNGTALDLAARLAIGHLLEDDGTVFLRYVRAT